MWDARKIVANICLAAATLFILLNSFLLARGATQWGLEIGEKIAYGAIAATVPVIIGIMPFLVITTFRKGKRWSRPTFWSLIGMGIWLVFAAYNLIGASGAIGFVRGAVIATRTHDYETVAALKAEREQLLKDRKNAGDARPYGTVEALIDGEKKQRDWQWTGECKFPSNSRQRTYCTGIDKLKAELAASKAAETIAPRLRQIDQALATTGAVDAVSDPQARMWSELTGIPEHIVARSLPLSTPIVLEIGSWFLLTFWLLLIGHTHTGLLERPTPAAKPLRPEQAEPPRLLESPETTALTRQVELVRWFFAHCTRPVAGGGLKEIEWYAHYVAEMRQSNTIPLPLDSFRRFAKSEAKISMVELDGVTYYKGVLPKIAA